MKGILINANERKVVAVDVKPDPNKDLDGLRALIGCDWVEPVVVGENLTLWLDEEGRLKLPRAGFRLSGIATDFAGNGVLLGGDAGRVRACKASPEVVALGVRWLAPGAVTPPRPPQLVFFP
jgi:hypothetical protein